jgi:hypothetical protein
MSFSLSGGVEILGFISPTEPTDGYAVIDPIYGIDGLRNVNTINDLNSITFLRRRAGMLVGVSGGTEYYKLKQPPWDGTLNDWEIFSLDSTFNGGIVTGNTIFTQGVTANTFFATTYVGLPLDVYITGGTYSNGTLTLVNNSGETFSVTGFSTGNTIDYYVTGGTFNKNTETLTLIRNDGGVVLVTGFTDLYVTGGTYSNGILTLTNNDGQSFLVDGFYTGGTDITITGGSYSDGTLTLVNTTGGTITVSGFYTGETDNNQYVTGFTYQDNTFTISDNSGNTFNATINSVTGLTVNGDLISDNFSGTTISGNTFYGDGSNLTNINNFITTAITLTTSQILTLGAGIELLPTPGSNKYYIIDKIILEYSFATTPYVFPTSLAFYLDGCFDSYIDRTLLTSSFNTVCVISGNLRNTYQVGSGSGS